MIIAFAILGLFVGAGIGEFWGAAIGCAAGAWLGHWLKKTKPPATPQEATIGSEPAARYIAPGLSETLDERVRSLARRVSHLVPRCRDQRSDGCSSHWLSLHRLPRPGGTQPSGPG